MINFFGGPTDEKTGLLLSKLIA